MGSQKKQNNQIVIAARDESEDVLRPAGDTHFRKIMFCCLVFWF